jgi:hypothetical protein
MVDVIEISALVAAAGVLVGVAYYILDIRHNMKAREMETCRWLSSDFNSEEGTKRYAAMMNLEWKDFKDFMQRYRYSNPEGFSKYASQFMIWETCGFLIKKKVVKAEDLYNLGGFVAITGWEKYKDIIQGLREVTWGKDFWSNAEFFAKEMLKLKLRKDASFKDKLKSILNTSTRK